MERNPYTPPGTTVADVAENAKAGANPHVLWRQVMGLVLWVGVLGYSARGFMGAAAGLLLGGVTFADAWTSGIYKDPSKKSFLNMSPMAWGIVMPLLLIITYPLYLANRNKLRTRQAGNGFFIATIALGGLTLISWFVTSFLLQARF